MPTTDLAARQVFTASLRELADYLDTWVRIPIPEFTASIIVIVDDVDDGGCQQVDQAAGLMHEPVTDHVASGGNYSTERRFGDITYRITAVSAEAMRRYEAFRAAYSNA
jgi:hypothetical protein